MNELSTAAAPHVSQVGFAGRPGFVKLIFKNGLLILLTTSIYRFWARTNMRRYLWNNVVIGGEPLEYTGRGIELFIGFLIASSILFPVFLLYTALQFLLMNSDWGLYALGFLYVAAIMVLTQVAIYRMRRYKLTR